MYDLRDMLDLKGRERNKKQKRKFYAKVGLLYEENVFPPSNLKEHFSHFVTMATTTKMTFPRLTHFFLHSLYCIK